MFMVPAAGTRSRAVEFALGRKTLKIQATARTSGYWWPRDSIGIHGQKITEEASKAREILVVI